MKVMVKKMRQLQETVVMIKVTTTVMTTTMTGVTKMMMKMSVMKTMTMMGLYLCSLMSLWQRQ